MLGLLDADERARYDRFLAPGARDEFLTGRVLVRTTLSSLFGPPPQSWSFRAGEHGKPSLVPGQVGADLRFNLSHTRNLVAVAVTLGRDLGVDVEAAERRGQTVEIADRYFASAETEALLALPPALQRERFFTLWTLKESYIKARGMGLAIPLGKFAFDLSRPGRIGLSTDPSLQDDANRWRFWLYRPDAENLLALGVERSDPAVAEVNVRWPLDPTAESDGPPVCLRTSDGI